MEANWICIVSMHPTYIHMIMVAWGLVHSVNVVSCRVEVSSEPELVVTNHIIYKPNSQG